MANIGLPYISDLYTLPVGPQIDAGFGQGKVKNVNKAYLRVAASGGIFAGPGADQLVEAKQRTIEPYGSPPALLTEVVEIVLDPEWGADGQVLVRQVDPLPLTLVSLTLDMTVGGS